MRVKRMNSRAFRVEQNENQIKQREHTKHKYNWKSIKGYTFNKITREIMNSFLPRPFHVGTR